MDVKVTRSSDPLVFETHDRLTPEEVAAGEFTVDDALYGRFAREAERVCKHLSPELRRAWAIYNAHQHPGFSSYPTPTPQGAPTEAGTQRVAQSVETQAREFRDLRVAFEQHKSAIGQNAETVSTNICSALREHSDALKDAIIVSISNLQSEIRMQAYNQAQAHAAERDEVRAEQRLQHQWAWYWRIAVFVALLLLMVMVAKAEPEPPLVIAGRYDFGLPAPQGPGPSPLTRVNLWQIAGVNLSTSVYNAANSAIQVFCVGGTCGGSGGTSSSFGSAFPATGTAIGVKNGANMVNLTADASNNLNVNCTVGCSGGSFNNNSDAVATSSTNGQAAAWLYGFNGTTFDRLRVDASKNLDVNINASSATVPVSGTVTANAGTNLNTSALALDTSVNGILLGQASTTSGQKGPLVQCAVTTAAPTYTTAQTDPASCNTSGGLRVDGSGVTQPISAASLPLPAGASTAANQCGSSTPCEVSKDTSANSATDPIFTRPTDATNAITAAISAFGTAPTGTEVEAVNAENFVGTAAQINDGTAGAAAVGGHFADNGVAAATNRVPTLNCIYQTSYLNGTAATQGRNGANSCGTDGLLWAAQLPSVRPASYVAAKNFAASSTTDNAVLPGNASNTVLVTMLKVSCTQTTAGIVHLQVIKRSAADTGGTSAAMTAVPDDSNYAGAVSAPLSYTGTGPSAGAAVGDVDDYYLGCLAAGTATPGDIYILNLRQKPIVLRGVAQQLAINVGNAALTGGNLNVTFNWIETATILP